MASCYFFFYNYNYLNKKNKKSRFESLETDRIFHLYIEKLIFNYLGKIFYLN